MAPASARSDVDEVRTVKPFLLRTILKPSPSLYCELFAYANIKEQGAGSFCKLFAGAVKEAHESNHLA
jgi:hypothetical protein